MSTSATRLRAHLVRRPGPAAATVALALASFAGCGLPTYDPLGLREEPVPAGGCAADADCAGRFCDTRTRACVDCLAAADCGDPKLECVDHACRRREGSCASNAECVTPPSPCHAAKGFCVTARAECDYPLKGAGAPCDDGDDCTTGDACDAEGACEGAEKRCDDSNLCTADRCERGRGCVNERSADGTSCGEHGEVCRGGECQCGNAQVETSCLDGADNDCDTNEDCGDEDCAGKACDDANPCTSGETCGAGGCGGGTPLACTTPPNTQCWKPAGSCDPSTGRCAYEPKGAGESCDDGNPCTTADACDGQGTCGGRAVECAAPPNGCHVAAGTCEPASGECVYAKAPAKTPCDDGNRCTQGDACDGNGQCVAATEVECGPSSRACAKAEGRCVPDTGECVYEPQPATHVCRPAKGDCDAPDTCDGTSLDCPSQNKVRAKGEVCRAEAAGGCDLADACDGVSAECPADRKKAADAACADDGNACTRDVCDGASNACQHPAGNAGATCRAPAGECDAPETCTGTSTTCPADAKVEKEKACTDDGNACTRDVCDGASNGCQHPAGNAGATCRASAGECDAPETCSGTSATCPGDAMKALNTGCMDDGNACTRDVCNGTSAACQHPVGNQGSVCREAAGECDSAETCTGTSATCPADEKVPAGKGCTPDKYQCSLDVCDGKSDSCQHPIASKGVECRPEAPGGCDAAEACDGLSPLCPADRKKAADVPCAEDGNACTRDVCDGTSNACQHPAGNRFAVCRAAQTCTYEALCDGTNAICPASKPRPAGWCDCGPGRACNGSGGCYTVPTEYGGTQCSDQRDNDCDGFADCDDSGCRNLLICF